MVFPDHIQVYTVGGAVRDGLLGLPVQDRDHVVVGATPEEMVHLGFQPVGKDFPVFLHPRSHEEYALARTERKTARGYKGFQVYSSPDVTLEEDLIRRDLTVNAMAMGADGRVVDPYGGRADLANRILRHVSPAFSEDPVRILRVARFSARFTEFDIAPETMTLMQTMVADGEVDALVPERVWQELARGLMENRPSRMFMVLRECGALARLIPELDRLFGVPQPSQFHPEIDTGIHTMMVVDWAAGQGWPLPVRLAALLHDLGKGTTPTEFWPRHHGHEGRSVALVKAVCERIRIPADCRDLAVLVARDHGNVHRAEELRPATVLELLERTDAFRRPERFAEFLLACEADFHGRTGFETRAYPPTALLKTALMAAQSVDAGAVARMAPEDIPGAIRAARLAVISAALGKNRMTVHLDTAHHDRDVVGMTYVYPVVSRRSDGVSVGINLNTNNACNWRCIYCQVPDLKRGGPPPINIEQLADELRRMLTAIIHGDFMANSVPEDMRRLNDIALSGNGEPTSAPEFPAIVATIARLLAEFDLLGQVKVVLISNGSLMHRPYVQAGLAQLREIGGEVWFKLDRASAEGMRQVNQTETTPDKVMRNLSLCAKLCPTWIQTCLFTLDGQPPKAEESAAYLAFLGQAMAADVPLKGVLLYGLARASTQPEASRLGRLPADWLDCFATRIGQAGLATRIFP